jgi:hypothetical protein
MSHRCRWSLEKCVIRVRPSGRKDDIFTVLDFPARRDSAALPEREFPLAAQLFGLCATARS